MDQVTKELIFQQITELSLPPQKKEDQFTELEYRDWLLKNGKGEVTRYMANQILADMVKSGTLGTSLVLASGKRVRVYWKL